MSSTSTIDFCYSNLTKLEKLKKGADDANVEKYDKQIYETLDKISELTKNLENIIIKAEPIAHSGDTFYKRSIANDVGNLPEFNRIERDRIAFFKNLIGSNLIMFDPIRLCRPLIYRFISNYFLFAKFRTSKGIAHHGP